MPTPPVPDNVPLEPLGATIPVTPERQIRADRSQRPPVAKEPSMESIKVYSPANMVGAPQNKQTPVKPIRGMSSKWRGSDLPQDKLSPFKTPGREDYSTVHQSTTMNQSQTMLSPSRYGDYNDRERTRGDTGENSSASRPTTTFTDMLTGIGFPDRGPEPAMPEIPRALDTKKKGKRI